MAISYLHFFSFTTYVFLAFYVLLKNPRENINRACAAVFVCMIFWSLHYVFRNAPGVPKSAALTTVKYGAIGWTLLGPTGLWFTLFFTGYGTLAQRRSFSLLLIIPAVILLAGQWQNKIICDLSRQPYGWVSVWTRNYWTLFFLLYFCLCLLVTMWVLYRYMVTTSNQSKKKQGQLIFYATIFVFFTGMFTDVFAPLTGIDSIPAMADILMLIWAASLAYAIIRYRLMTISPATAAENIISTMSDLLMLTDSQLRITVVNAATLECLGFERDEIIGMGFERLISKNEPAKENLTNGISLRTIHSEQMMLETKTRQQVPVIISGSPLKDEEGENVGLVLVAKDISEQKRVDAEKKHLEAQLVKAQRLEAIGTLAGGVAHDLNNILAGIVSYPDLIMHDMPPEDPIYQPLLTIKKSGEKAAAIVEDLLAMARRGVRNTTTVDLNRLVEEFLKSPEYRHLISFKPDVEVNVVTEENLWSVEASTFHISKVLMNLFSNALEALTNEGIVTITNRNQHVTNPIRGYETIPPGHYVTLTLSDNGSGIAPEDLEHIFEPFYTKKSMGRSGTGLGMAVVWGTIKDHHGYIDVRSRLSEGTSVTLYLPAAEDLGLGDGDPDDDKPIATGHKERVLVVDDMDDQRKLAASILTILGYQVSTASDGEEAVELVSKYSFDLVLLDMIMDPGIDGLETYRRMCAVRPNQKAVIASGFAESERVSEALILGAHSFIQKPYAMNAIAKTIREALDADPSDR